MLRRRLQRNYPDADHADDHDGDRRWTSYDAPTNKHPKDEGETPLSEERQEEVEEHLPLRSPVMY